MVKAVRHSQLLSSVLPFSSPIASQFDKSPLLPILTSSLVALALTQEKHQNELLDALRKTVKQLVGEYHTTEKAITLENTSTQRLVTVLNVIFKHGITGMAASVPFCKTSRYPPPRASFSLF